jgi:hypothetical protein
MDRLIHPALLGKPVAWFAPNYRLLSDVWRELQTLLDPVIAARNYAAVVIDEAAMVANLEHAWQSIRPILTDLQGPAWFLSTPKGMSFFKMLFDRGQDSTRQDWASWQMSSSENPYIDPGEIEAARLDMTESAFNQEYLALFVNWEGSVFRRVGGSGYGEPQRPERDR